MKIIIAGCGKVGRAIAQQLSEEGHDLTIIDTSEEKLTAIGNALDVMTIFGNAASFQVQREAGIESADLLIAVMGKDEVNLLTCLIARKAGHCQTIARVRDPGYYYEIGNIKDELGLSLALNPELSAAYNVTRLLQIPSAMDVESFAKGKVNMVRFRVPESSAWSGKKIYEVSKRFGGNMLICAIERSQNKQVEIPDGNAELQSGDYIHVVAAPSRIDDLFESIGVHKKRMRNIIIAGGGTLGYYLARELSHTRMSITIIEIDRNRCEELSELLPGVRIICGDATDTDLLLEEGVETADAFIALVGMDEENVMLSCYVSRASKAKVVTKIKKITYGGILDSFDIGSKIAPKNLTAEEIIKYVRGMQESVSSDVETLYRLIDNQVEALEFYIKGTCLVQNVPLSELKLKDNLLLCCIVRSGKVILPTGQDMIQTGDTVVVVTTHKGLNSVDEILADNI